MSSRVREPIATNVQTVRFKGMRAAPRSSVERPGHALASFREPIGIEYINVPPAPPPAPPPDNNNLNHFNPLGEQYIGPPIQKPNITIPQGQVLINGERPGLQLYRDLNVDIWNLILQQAVNLVDGWSYHTQYTKPYNVENWWRYDVVRVVHGNQLLFINCVGRTSREVGRHAPPWNYVYVSRPYQVNVLGVVAQQ